MKTFETLSLEVKDGVAWLRLNRPESFNAMNLTMTKELYQAAVRCTADPSIRVVVFTSAGKVFSGGGEFAGKDDKVRPVPVVGVFSSDG